jgi:membrane protease YdiL (CAAX protease family)
LQVAYAVAIGFAFVMICCRTGSLLPCILTHGIFNGLSAFANEAAVTPQREILSGSLLTLIGGGYALYLALAVKEDTDKM